MMDRDTTEKAKSQIGFIKFVVLPLYQVAHKKFSECFQEPLNHLEENLKNWEKLQEESSN